MLTLRNCSIPNTQLVKSSSINSDIFEFSFRKITAHVYTVAVTQEYEKRKKNFEIRMYTLSCVRTKGEQAVTEYVGCRESSVPFLYFIPNRSLNRKIGSGKIQFIVCYTGYKLSFAQTFNTAAKWQQARMSFRYSELYKRAR